ncbi:hypothetical protein DFJ74DRAFT_702338 [Hyaloraphidium curvatum]|nr:hypothetical protein DFJ74DRAFT_702338 [Hyaloraphidium curvatum]
MVAGLIAGAAKAVLGGGGGGGPSAAPTSVTTATHIHNYVYDVGKSTAEVRVANEGAVTGQQDAAVSNRQAADVSGSQHGSVSGSQSQAADFSQAASVEASLANTATNTAHGGHATADAQAKAQQSQHQGQHQVQQQSQRQAQAQHQAPPSEGGRAPARADGVLSAADEEAIAGLFPAVQGVGDRLTAVEGELRTKDAVIATLSETVAAVERRLAELEAQKTADAALQAALEAGAAQADSRIGELFAKLQRMEALLAQVFVTDGPGRRVKAILVDVVKAARVELGNFAIQPSRVNPTEHLEITQVRPATGNHTEFPIALFGGLLGGMPRFRVYLKGRVAGSADTLTFYEVGADGETRVVVKTPAQTPPNHEVGGVTF